MREGTALSHRARMTPSIFDEAFFNESLFYPRAECFAGPPGATDVRVEVEGASLHLRLHRAEEASCVALLFHGNGEVVSEYDELAPSFARAGAALAAVDYRGYGASTGRPTLRACLRDAEAVLAALLARVDRPVVVVGRSLGSLCAAALCQRPREGVRGYVFDSGIADLEGLARRHGVPFTPPLPEADLADFDPLRRFARCVDPVLWVHGGRDGIIPVAEARLAHARFASREKRLVVIDDAGHNDLFARAAYWQALAGFFRPSA